jgi:hypothetical protein
MCSVHSGVLRQPPGVVSSVVFQEQKYYGFECRALCRNALLFQWCECQCRGMRRAVAYAMDVQVLQFRSLWIR